MPVTFAILPRLGLVYVRYWGFAALSETIAQVQAYGRHPDFRPGQKHLIDMAGVTGYERDFPAIMQMMAGITDVLMQRPTEVLVVYLTPTPLAQDMARAAIRSWEGMPGLVTRMQEDEAAALSLLGLPHGSIAEMFAKAG
jgi:hypothetical protein